MIVSAESWQWHVVDGTPGLVIDGVVAAWVLREWAAMPPAWRIVLSHPIDLLGTAWRDLDSAKSCAERAVRMRRGAA